jgi:hypothetical protein
MGLCFSCHRTPERDPLLRTTTEEPPIAPKLHKAADVLAAINSRKLPSQDQLNSILRKLLKSNVLSDPAALAGYGPLSDRSRKVMVDARELIEATLQIGMEKNRERLFLKRTNGAESLIGRSDDDRLQDLVFQGSSIDENSVRIDADVQAKGTRYPSRPNA